MNSSSVVLMVPPDGFQFNHETASSNAFQELLDITDISKKAMFEFSNMVSSLKEQGVEVLILNQKETLPDAVFPNNWFSAHINTSGQNSLIIYPMLTKNRQDEVNIEGLIKVLNDAGIMITQIIDLRKNTDQILEGTGSLVLDRDNQIIYASLSPRTSKDMVLKVAQILNYRTVVFHALDTDQTPIYHTNVIMGIAKQYAIICLESIKDSKEREILVHSLLQTNKTIIDISLEQVNNMCGNVLELYNNKNQSLLVLSTRAYLNLSPDQIDIIQHHSIIVPVDIQTIETIGGGSARCMMTEIIPKGNL